MLSTPRRVAACALGLALFAGPVVAGADGAGAASLKRAKSTWVASVTMTAQRTVASTMQATVVASIPDSTIAPIRVTMSASATRSASGSAKSSARKTVVARAATTKKAKSKARTLARKGARVIAQRRAVSLASSDATTKARAAAEDAARSEAIQRASASAVAQAKATAPNANVTPQLVAVDPATAPCGGVLPTKADGTGRYSACSFDDNFSGSTLDTSKWTALDAQKTPFVIGDECFKPENVGLSGGALQLTATKAAAPLTCSKAQRNYQSGLIMSKGKFTQTYGRFEMRAKFPSDAGYVSGFWMLPENPFGANMKSYKYGEIDIVENWALHPELKWAHLHYAATPGNAMGGKSCVIANDGNFHTYAVDWSPSKMTFIYDGNACWSTTWQPYYPYAPAGSKAPAPFDQPFYMILNLSVGGSGSTLAQPLSKTPMGKSMQVDWVRAWK